MGQGYNFTKNSEKFLIYKIDKSKSDAILFFLDNKNNVYFNYELTAEKSENEITQGDIISYYSYDPYLDLQFYNKQSLYLFIYVKNEYSLEPKLYTKYLKLITPQEKRFTQIQEFDNVYFYNYYRRIIFFFYSLSKNKYIL